MIRLSARLRTAAAAVMLTAAATGTAVAVAGPANADNESCTTRTVVTVNSKAANQRLVYGTYANVTAKVTASCPTGDPDFADAGTLVLQKSLNGGSTWRTVQTRSSANGQIPDYASVYGKYAISRNTVFRAVYSGSTNRSASAWSDTFTASSDSISVHVYRHVGDRHTCARKGCTYTFTIKPAASIRGLTVKFQRVVGGKWRTRSHVRVSSNGTFRHLFTLGKTRILIPGGRGYLGSTGSVRVYRY